MVRLAATAIGVLVLVQGAISCIGQAVPPSHEVSVLMPTRLKGVRSASRLAISYDLGGLKPIRVLLEDGMSLGMRDELRVYAQGDPRPEKPMGIGLNSVDTNHPGSTSHLKSTIYYNRSQGGIPAPGKTYLIEEDITLFQTGSPAGHMWDPMKGPNYEVLWQGTVH